MRSHLTIRGLPRDVAEALDRECRQRGASLNRTVVALLRRALGKEPGHRYDNGLARLAATWSASDLRAFEKATRAFEQVDPELWS